MSYIHFSLVKTHKRKEEQELEGVRLSRNWWLEMLEQFQMFHTLVIRLTTSYENSDFITNQWNNPHIILWSKLPSVKVQTLPGADWKETGKSVPSKLTRSLFCIIWHNHKRLLSREKISLKRSNSTWINVVQISEVTSLLVQLPGNWKHPSAVIYHRRESKLSEI